MKRALSRVLAVLLVALASTLPVPAQAETAVDLQLVLAVDASGSVNETRFEMQKQGYVAAFRHPEVLRAIRSGPLQQIAVTMIQWTGPEMQTIIVPWTLIKDAATAHQFANAIEAAPRRLFAGGTSISGAIDFASGLFAGSGFKSALKVIDVSGDGPNNRGHSVVQARDRAVASGIKINGLPILALVPDLDDYYHKFVIGGPGSFMLPAASYEAFPDAVRKKLVLEISDNRLGLTPVPTAVKPRR
ncbi:MAG: DUF1194 domain-containing protein [Hyphomicrobiaceae bacterium]|nr:DUF1194 domain-containing protein [Hyphomicrobiaceae bacterium]